MTHFEKALQYVRDNKTWPNSLEDYALSIINEHRCDIEQASPKIADEICDLMEEYGQDNDLPEGWWMEYASTDDIFFELGDTDVDKERLLRETIAVLSADIYTIIYNPDKGMGWKETSAQIVSWAERFESELNWKDNDERDFITELEKFERKVLEEYGEC